MATVKEEATPRSSALVEASLLLTVFFFGTNFVAVKLVVADVPPVLFAAARFTLAGSLLFVISRFAERGTRLKRGDLLPVLGLGVVGITLTQTVFTVGVGLTTAANTALVYSTSPVWGMLLGFALGLERPRLAGVLGICLSLVGVGFIVYGGLEFAGTSLVGDALILAAAVCWGSYTVLSLGLLERYPPISLAAYSMILGGLVAFPLSLFDPHTFDTAAIDSTTWTAAAYSMLFSSAFGFAAWGSGVSRVGANRVLIYQYLVTVIGVSAGIVLLGESFGPEQLIGAAVIVAGVYLAKR
ncbi:MAG: Permease of the drug/metabolite transporter (DMT) superfamily [uncultured Rubrobacteraceae bacterium]|uniref:Permease of the drug/metabolite transporter (DMT) superfamily n=1 Tax=uncultured Rubrobacteraceae bacterium TaxID=349277 RepID=A0A6J4RUH2_9ACTN|nr:MAG: Permease of the drug/metabolite transporter (DMT) superfamily [uncultured Rubrobacteraceae bacterium]